MAGSRKDTYFFKNFLSVELNLARLITFFLRTFMRRNLDIRNHREKLDQNSTNTNQNSKKNFASFLASGANLAKCPKFNENFNIVRFCRR